MLGSQFFAIFDNFQRKKLAFFSKANVKIKFLYYIFSFVLSNKTPIFCQFFGENISKMITSIPGVNLLKPFLPNFVANYFGFSAIFSRISEQAIGKYCFSIHHLFLPKKRAKNREALLL
jgi:hypothetical protein